MATEKEFDIVTNPDRPTIEKRAASVKDYTFDWADWLTAEDDLIASVTLIADGVTADSYEVVTQNKVKVWVSGGTLGELHSLTCRITTDNSPPRIDERVMFFKII